MIRLQITKDKLRLGHLLKEIFEDVARRLPSNKHLGNENLQHLQANLIKDELKLDGLQGMKGNTTFKLY